ncbi:MAG: histidine phosphatase family protein [Anaerolineales bacterium]|nr:histidine phosphatase family protein [Anaerolineales bacterium]MCB9127303.1 histidine phosphatase family protein [Ardenticatenales bacterium]MCB9172592.1 histidine phosphatase family protein [Ardenticatenales bacterium]
MHFYIVRHGQSFVNLPGWEGDWDAGLTELGQHQARAVAGWLADRVPDAAALYASTMRRARETMQSISAAYGMAPTFDDRLREIGNNRLDHTAWSADEMPTEYSEYWASERPFSNVTPSHELGETHVHFRSRVGSFLEETARRHPDQAVVVVAHGGVVEIALDHIFDVGLFRRTETWTENTGVTHIEYLEPKPRRERWRLHRHNRTDHLAQQSAQTKSALEDQI